MRTGVRRGRWFLHLPAILDCRGSDRPIARVRRDAGDRRAAQGAREGHLLLGGRRGADRPRARHHRGDAARGAGRRSSRARCCSPTSTSTTRARPARWCGAGRTCRSTCTSAARRTWSTRRSWWPAPGRLYGGDEGLRAAVGRDGPGARGEPARAHAAARRGVEGAFRVEYTPGHASHHVCYLHEPSGWAFVGDIGGARIPPHDFTVAPTPPPDIDVAAWERSIAIVRAWNPTGLGLTHFGAGRGPERQLDALPARRSTPRSSSRRAHDEAGFVAAMEARVREGCGADARRDDPGHAAGPAPHGAGPLARRSSAARPRRCGGRLAVRPPSTIRSAQV